MSEHLLQKKDLCVQGCTDKNVPSENRLFLIAVEQKAFKTKYIVTGSHCSFTELAVPSYLPPFSILPLREVWGEVVSLCFPSRVVLFVSTSEEWVP